MGPVRFCPLLRPAPHPAPSRPPPSPRSHPRHHPRNRCLASPPCFPRCLASPPCFPRCLASPPCFPRCPPRLPLRCLSPLHQIATASGPPLARCTGPPGPPPPPRGQRAARGGGRHWWWNSEMAGSPQGWGEPFAAQGLALEGHHPCNVLLSGAHVGRAVGAHVLVPHVPRGRAGG